MAIPEYVRNNFNTLLRAAHDGNLGLMECRDVATREVRYVLCAFGCDGTDVIVVPFGHLVNGNPYDDYLPPEPDQPHDMIDVNN